MSDLDDLLRSSVAGVFSRGLRGGDLRRGLLEEGWAELFDVDPGAAIAGLAGEQGRLLVEASPALDLVLVHALRREEPAAAGLDASGLAVVVPTAGGSEPVCGSIDDRGVVGSGLATAGALDAAQLLLPCREGREGPIRLVVIDRDVAGVELTPVGGLDPSVGLYRVTLDHTVAGRVLDDDSRRAWGATVAVGRVALGFELLGVAEAMLATTRAYVGERRQFGRVIGTFQAVRHRLADVHVAVSAARLALEEAVARPTPLNSAIAKGLAGAAHLSASTWCLQLHGAVGFTWEHGLHRYIRRGRVLDALVGSCDELDAWLGGRLWDDRSVPRLAELVSP